MTPVWFVVAAALGALTRHGVNRLDHGWLGTLGVNVIGAFGLGWLVASDASTSMLTIVGTGLLGSFTTFSTFALEASEGDRSRRLLVVGVTLAVGLAAGALGMAVGG